MLKKCIDSDYQIFSKNTLTLNTNCILVSHADNTQVYGCTSKRLDGLEPGNLSSDLVLAVKWRGNWLITFNVSIIKLVKFHCYR